MDYFENIVKRLLEEEAKWVKQSVKVDIDKSDKKLLEKYSMPRPEIDLVTYSPKFNTLELWEVKSYLDSPGVSYDHICVEYDTPEGRYKLLTCKIYRDIIVEALVDSWVNKGLILDNPKIIFGLAAGNFVNGQEGKIRDLFADKNNWRLVGPKEIFMSIQHLETLAYENDPYTIAAKLIFRHFKEDLLRLGISPHHVSILIKNGYYTVNDICAEDEKKLLKIDGIGKATVDKIVLFNK